jgi:hypothetical protein
MFLVVPRILTTAAGEIFCKTINFASAHAPESLVTRVEKTRNINDLYAF